MLISDYIRVTPQPAPYMAREHPLSLRIVSVQYGLQIGRTDALVINARQL